VGTSMENFVGSSSRELLQVCFLLNATPFSLCISEVLPTWVNPNTHMLNSLTGVDMIQKDLSKRFGEK